jgi:hypothetical protein
MTGLESIQCGETSFPVTDRSTITSTAWHQCPGDRGVRSLEHGDTSVPLTDRSGVTLTGWHQYPGFCFVCHHFNRLTAVSLWLTCLVSLWHIDTSVLVSDMFRVNSITWQQCPCDWQVYNHFNRVTPVFRWLTGRESLQQGEKSIQWLTGLELHQYNNSNVLVTGRCCVRSTVWHQYPCDGEFYSNFKRVTLMSWWLAGLDSL